MGAYSTLVYLAPLGIATAISAGLVAVGWLYRSRPGARSFAALMAAATVWSAGYTVGLVVYDPQFRLLFLQVTWVGIAFVPVAWLAFALEYTGYGRFVTKRAMAGLSVLPLSTLALAWTPPLHWLLWPSRRLVVADGLVFVHYRSGPWYLLNLGYSYLLFAIGVVVLFRLAVSENRLYADQSVAIGAGALVPFVANVVSHAWTGPIPGLDFTPFALSVTGLLFGLALLRFELFDLLPVTYRIGRSAAVSNLQEGILIVDRNGRIVDANPAVRAVFDRPAEALIGEPLGEVLGEEEPADESLAPSELRTEDGRVFAVTVSDVRDRSDRHPATSLCFAT